MGQATYNAGSTDLKRPAIVPYPDEGHLNGLEFGCVRTTVGEAPIARRVYVFPGLSGMGSEYCGRRALRIEWDLTVVARSMGDLVAFLKRFDCYAGLPLDSAGRFVKGYPLVSELDKTWKYVELAGVKPIEEFALARQDDNQPEKIFWHGIIRWERITPPLGVNAGPDVACHGVPVQLAAAVSGGEEPYTYEWSPSEGLDDPTVLQPMAELEETTTYTLTATDSEGHTTSDDSVVTVDSPPP